MKTYTDSPFVVLQQEDTVSVSTVYQLYSPTRLVSHIWMRWRHSKDNGEPIEEELRGNGLRNVWTSFLPIVTTTRATPSLLQPYLLSHSPNQFVAKLPGILGRVGYLGPLESVNLARETGCRPSSRSPDAACNAFPKLPVNLLMEAPFFNSKLTPDNRPWPAVYTSLSVWFQTRDYLKRIHHIGVSC